LKPVNKPAQQKDSTPDEKDPDQPAPLTYTERTAAVIVGVAASGTGTTAVFVTDNQAGTAALFVVAVAFLLIGIQGTPLTRFASGDNSADFARRQNAQKAKDVLKDAKKAEEQGDSATADNLFEVATILDPAVENLPEVQAFRYEQRVGEAITRLFGHTNQFRLMTGERYRSPDFRLVTDGQELNIEALYRRRQLCATWKNSGRHVENKPADTRSDQCSTV
jgi:hypothetical protein